MKSLLLQIDIVSDTITQANNANEIIAEEKTLSILELITSGGTGGNLIMIALALLSIISVYLFFERFNTIKRASKQDPSFFSSIKNYVEDKDLKASGKNKGRHCRAFT